MAVSDSSKTRTRRLTLSELEALNQASTRFWSHVQKSDGCWLWTSYCLRDGYGLFDVLKKKYRAHRVSWILIHQAQPEEGVFILHSCDNPKCVNPDHLRPGDAADNARDAVERGRVGWQMKPKLTESDVAAIKIALSHGESKSSLARKFGVHRTNIGAIARGETSAHVRPDIIIPQVKASR